MSGPRRGGGPRGGGGAPPRWGGGGPRGTGGGRDDRGGGPRDGGGRDDRGGGFGGGRDERGGAGERGFGGRGGDGGGRGGDERGFGGGDRGGGGRGGDRGGRGAGGPGERAVYGVGPVREIVARKPQSVRALWVDPRRADKSGSDPVAQIVTAARAAGIRVEDRDREGLERAVGEDARHQGIVAWLGAMTYVDLDAMVGGDEPALIIALDGVEDPRNLGAILRSAYLLGATGVIIPEHRAAQVTAVAAKASAGASELLPIAQVGNLVRALDELRELGVWRVAVHATETSQPIAAIDGTLPLVLVLGAEGFGVRPLVAKNCDFHAVIPMARTGVGSFNVSVAASLALYEMRRQRAAQAVHGSG
jgi:23S rRNA (guanosine2251-2'-O)-methyltransferase